MAVLITRLRLNLLLLSYSDHAFALDNHYKLAIVQCTSVSAGLIIKLLTELRLPAKKSSSCFSEWYQKEPATILTILQRRETSQ